MLTTWDILTGKRTDMQKFKLSDNNTSSMCMVGYKRFTTIDDGKVVDIYKSGIYEWTLLRKIREESNVAHLIESSVD